jgi:hypothetical protein
MHPQSTTDHEEWRPVVGYEGWYSVSSLGRVRRDMPGRCTSAGRVLHTKAPTSGGYLQVSLSRSTGGKQTTLSIHTLVAVAFLTPRPEGHSINHINGIKTDNRVSNLEWVTPKQNSQHAVALGLMPAGDRSSPRLYPDRYPKGDTHHARLRPEVMARGSANGNSKLTDEIVREIRASTEDRAVLAARYNLNKETVSRVRLRQCWKHVI